VSERTDLELPLHATALICVDFQNDFCSPDGFFERAGHDISTCAAAFERTVVVAAACREAGVAVVLTRTVRTDAPVRRLRPSRHPGESATGTAGNATLGNDRYLPDAWGTQIVPALGPRPGDVLIEKPRQSPFFGTKLEQELRARAIEVVIVAGVTTNCCVDSTIRDAAVRDFDVLVLEDCVAAFGAEQHLHTATLENAARFFGVVVPSVDFLGQLGVPVHAEPS
jgi:nicotinamidase-related amidase